VTLRKRGKEGGMVVTGDSRWIPNSREIENDGGDRREEVNSELPWG